MRVLVSPLALLENKTKDALSPVDFGQKMKWTYYHQELSTPFQAHFPTLQDPIPSALLMSPSKGFYQGPKLWNLPSALILNSLLKTYLVCISWELCFIWN